MSTRTPIKPIGELCLQLKMLLNAESDRNVRGYLWRSLHNLRQAAHTIARQRYPFAYSPTPEEYPPVVTGYLHEHSVASAEPCGAPDVPGSAASSLPYEG